MIHNSYYYSFNLSLYISYYNWHIIWSEWLVQTDRQTDKIITVLPIWDLLYTRYMTMILYKAYMYIIVGIKLCKCCVLTKNQNFNETDMTHRFWEPPFYFGHTHHITLEVAHIHHWLWKVHLNTCTSSTQQKWR